MTVSEEAEELAARGILRLLYLYLRWVLWVAVLCGGRGCGWDLATYY